MSRIGLMMIVKDEAHVIEACLRSARELVDWWVIADTGSTDGTQDVVRRVMEGVPGEVVDRPWVDFGHNRQEVLDLARASPHAEPGDYAVWIDADEQFRDPPETWGRLEDDGYFLTVVYGTTRYARLAVVSLDRPWVWRGPIHEYLDLPAARLGTLATPHVVVEHSGARSQDPDTYRKDAAQIEAALLQDPGNPRLQFYLAQSWRDAGESERAVAAYHERYHNESGWDQERWYSLYQIAVLLERLRRPAGEVIEAYLTAYHVCPWRAEPLVELARYERLRERFSTALLYARPAARLPMPGGEGLFVDADTYEWRAWDEVAVSCYWSGRYADGVVAATKALAARPDDERLRANLAWCQDRLTG